MSLARTEAGVAPHGNACIAAADSPSPDDPRYTLATPSEQAVLSGLHRATVRGCFRRPAGSVVDRYHRSHKVPSVFVCDGSNRVTSGCGQPMMTIQALAFRAAGHIGEFARRREI